MRSVRLFDLLLLQLDGLVVHKDSLPLVRLRHSPPPNPGCERVHDLLVDALEDDPRWLRHAGRDALRYAHLDRMREAELEDDELLAGVLLEFGPGIQRSSVTDPYQSQGGGDAF